MSTFTPVSYWWMCQSNWKVFFATAPRPACPHSQSLARLFQTLGPPMHLGTGQCMRVKPSTVVFPQARIRMSGTPYRSTGRDSGFQTSGSAVGAGVAATRGRGGTDWGRGATQYEGITAATAGAAAAGPGGGGGGGGVRVSPDDAAISPKAAS